MEKQCNRPIYPYMPQKLILPMREERPQLQLRAFWANEMEEIQRLDSVEVKKKNHGSLPLARVKKIMKADEEKMVSAEAAVVLAKACELMMKELSVRAWVRTQDGKRRTLQKKDIWGAVGESDVFDFLVDVIPRLTVTKEQGYGHMAATGNFDYSNPLFNFMTPFSDGFMGPAWSSH